MSECKGVSVTVSGDEGEGESEIGVSMCVRGWV